jgi:hypothetical protein
MLKHLSLAEMAALGLAWVNKGARRDTFLSIPEIAPLHPTFTDAHSAILAAQPADKSMSPELRSVVAEGNALDLTHDRLARAGSLGLELTRELCLAATPPDTDRATMCERVANKLYPEGLSFLNTSWLAEAGNVARVEKLLEQEPELRPFLKSVVLPGKITMMDVVDRWIAAGKALGKVDEKREALLAKLAPPDKATIQAARSRWMRVVSTVLNNLELSAADGAAIEAIRGPVLRASERAGKRYATGETETPVLEAEAPSGEDGAAKPA